MGGRPTSSHVKLVPQILENNRSISAREYGSDIWNKLCDDCNQPDGARCPDYAFGTIFPEH